MNGHSMGGTGKHSENYCPNGWDDMSAIISRLLYNLAQRAPV